jgi:hypothetical protein
MKFLIDFVTDGVALLLALTASFGGWLYRQWPPRNLWSAIRNRLRLGLRACAESPPLGIRTARLGLN